MKKNNFIEIIPIVLLILALVIPKMEASNETADTLSETKKEKIDPIFTDTGEIFTLNKEVSGSIPAGYRLEADLFEGTVKYSIDGVNFKNWTGGQDCPYPKGNNYYFQSKNKNQKIQLWLVKNY